MMMMMMIMLSWHAHTFSSACAIILRLMICGTCWYKVQSLFAVGRTIVMLVFCCLVGAESSETWTRRPTSGLSRSTTTSSIRWLVTWSNNSAPAGVGSRCCVSCYSTHSIWHRLRSTTRWIIRTGSHDRTFIQTASHQRGINRRHCRESISY